MTSDEADMERVESLPRREGQAFDTWLRRALHVQHDTALNEPVPDEIARIAEDVAKKRQ